MDDKLHEELSLTNRELQTSRLRSAMLYVGTLVLEDSNLLYRYSDISYFNENKFYFDEKNFLGRISKRNLPTALQKLFDLTPRSMRRYINDKAKYNNEHAAEYFEEVRDDAEELYEEGDYSLEQTDTIIKKKHKFHWLTAERIEIYGYLESFHIRSQSQELIKKVKSI